MTDQSNDTTFLSARERRELRKRKREEDRMSVRFHFTATETMALELETVVEHLRSLGAKVNVSHVVRTAITKFVSDYRKNNGLTV